MRSPPTRRTAPVQGGSAGTRRNVSERQGSTSRLVLVPPFDPEVELAVLAEVAEPLHRLTVAITPGDFYDPRHCRIVEALQSGQDLSADDAAYLKNAIGSVWPVTRDILDRFVEYAARRRRIAELEDERLSLYGVAL
jgi:hypothetical protein